MQYIPTDLPQYWKIHPRSDFSNALIEQNHVLLFSQDGQSLTVKKPDGTYEVLSGSNSSVPSAELQAGVLVNDNGVLKVQPLKFDGTAPSDSGSLQEYDLKIFDTGRAEPDYGGAAPSASMDFYKCTYVSSDSSMTWRGRKAVLSNSLYNFQSNSTEGLQYSSITPVVNSIYTQNALQKISYLPLDTLNEGLVFYAPFTSVEPNAATGQSLTYGQGHNITVSKQDGIMCLKSAADPNDSRGVTSTDTDLPMGTDPCTISLWVKWAVIWQNYNADNIFGYGDSARAIGCGVNQSYYNGLFYIYLANSDGFRAPYVSPLKWHNILAVYNNEIRSMYVDGIFIDSKNKAFNTSIGSLIVANNRYADIYFTSARIYNRALSDFEIKMLANEFTPTA